MTFILLSKKVVNTIANIPQLQFIKIALCSGLRDAIKIMQRLES